MVLISSSPFLFHRAVRKPHKGGTKFFTTSRSESTVSWAPFKFENSSSFSDGAACLGADAGLTIGSGCRRLSDPAATEGFAVFAVRAADSGVDGGATAARFCGDKSFAAASGGASKGGIALLKKAVKKVCPF